MRPDSHVTRAVAGMALVALAACGATGTSAGGPEAEAPERMARASGGRAAGSSGLDLGVAFDPAQEASAPRAADGQADSAAPTAPGPQDASAGELDAQAAAYPIDGYVSVGFRGRWSSGASDGDLFTFLSMDGGDPNKHAVTFHVTARASQDLSGGKEPGDRFFEISDTYSNGFNPRLYRAYVDVHSVEELDILRLGRQQDIETPVPAYYDGAHVRSREVTAANLHVGAYGGFSTHLFESTTEDDRVFGAYLGSNPWDGGRVRVDWMRARDSLRSSGKAEDMYSLSLWQTVLQTLDLEGFYSRFRDEDRDLRLSGSWFQPLWDLQLRASYYQLLTRQTTSALEFDPFTSSLLDFEPYHLVSLSGSKGIGSRYRVAGGADLRRLENDGDAGRFNRDFDRFFVTFSLLELLQEQGSLNLTTDFWDGDDRRYSTWGLDYAGEINQALRGSIGTFFSMYKISTLTFEEREDVRTWFVRLDHDLTDALRLNFDYQYEDAELADFHVLRMDLRWSF